MEPRGRSSGPGGTQAFRHRHGWLREPADASAGLSLAEVARRLGVQPLALQVLPSLMAVYDELFRRGQAEHLAVMRLAMAGAAPGLAALTAGLEATGRWLLASRAIARLMS